MICIPEHVVVQLQLEQDSLGKSFHACFIKPRKGLAKTKHDDARIRQRDILESTVELAWVGLARFDVVIANPPFSLEGWGRELWENDPWASAFAGLPTDSNGDMAWVQYGVCRHGGPGPCGRQWTDSPGRNLAAGAGRARSDRECIDGSQLSHPFTSPDPALSESNRDPQSRTLAQIHRSARRSGLGVSQPPHCGRAAWRAATFLFHHFLDAGDLAWLRGLTSEPLTDDEARALVFVREVGAIDNGVFRSFGRSDTLTASIRLRRLRDLGLLAMRGSGNRTD
jgi:hypothetical protein